MSKDINIEEIVNDKWPMVKLLTHIVGLFDRYGVNHGDRVAHLSVLIAKQNGEEQECLEILQLSALLHDIGKVAIPEAIRVKPGKLMVAEEMIMRSHPEFGLGILELMNGTLDPRVYDAVLYHHERWDGSGYPKGLVGEQIPKGARYIGIADSYDAMTHSRGIRSPMTHNKAMHVLKHENKEDKLFDPKIFKTFVDLMDGFQTEKHVREVIQREDYRYENDGE